MNHKSCLRRPRIFGVPLPSSTDPLHQGVPEGAGCVSRVLGEGDGGACGSVGKSPAKAPEMLKKDVFGGDGYDEISKMVVGDSKMNDMERRFVQRRILASEEVGKVGNVFSRQRWGKSVEISEEIGSQTSVLGMPVQSVARSLRGRALVPPVRFRDSAIVDQPWSASAGVCGKLSLCSKFDDTQDNEKVMKVEVCESFAEVDNLEFEDLKVAQ